MSREKLLFCFVILLIKVLSIESTSFLSSNKLISSSILPIKKLGEVSKSGDQYPKLLPKVQGLIFANKKILFAMSDGVEDHEVYYQYQFFSERGGQIDIGCMLNSDIIISDFFRPTHRLQCIDLKNIDLNKYDAIFIPGGLPSSSELRENSDFQLKLLKYYNSGDENKLLSIICSGSENLIDSGILKKMNKNDEITGSPAAQWSFFAVLDFLKRPRSLFKGNDDNGKAIGYKANNNHINLVLGKNPASSVEFVIMISKIWKGVDEGIPDENNNSKLKLKDDYYFENPLFEALYDDLDIDSLKPKDNKIINEQKNNQLDLIKYEKHIILNKLNSDSLKDKNIAVAISSGTEYESMKQIEYFVKLNKANLTILCPGWVKVWKERKIFLFTEIPRQIKGLILCDYGFDEILSKKIQFDSLIIPGGLFSTHGVLRNDADLNKLVNIQKNVVLIGTGNVILISMDEKNLAKGTNFVQTKYCSKDLINAGGKINENKKIEKFIKNEINFFVTDNNILEILLELGKEFTKVINA